jgi:hypothetical protein
VSQRTSWFRRRSLAKRVGSRGHVTVTDLQLGFLNEITADNVEVLRL